MFDNGAVPKVHPQSRGLVLPSTRRPRPTRVLAQYEHPGTALSSGSQGNMQTLANGDVFIGWGAEPYFSEFSAAGQLLYDAHMHGSYQSYRAYRFPWTGAPQRSPRDRRRRGAAGAPVTVYASWNGDTRTASWRVLGRRLAAAARAGRHRSAQRLRDRDQRARRREPTWPCRRWTRPAPCSATSRTIGRERLTSRSPSWPPGT